MNRSGKNGPKRWAGHRLKKIKLLLKTNGISFNTLGMLEEIILKDAVDNGNEIGIQQQRVFIDFLKARAEADALQPKQNPLEIPINTLQEMEHRAESNDPLPKMAKKKVL